MYDCPLFVRLRFRFGVTSFPRFAVAGVRARARPSVIRHYSIVTARFPRAIRLRGRGGTQGLGSMAWQQMRNSLINNVMVGTLAFFRPMSRATACRWLVKGHPYHPHQNTLINSHTTTLFSWHDIFVKYLRRGVLIGKYFSALSVLQCFPHAMGYAKLLYKISFYRIL